MEPDWWAWVPSHPACQADGRPPWTPQELKLKDEECERLSKVREQLERELEELTASLFEVPRPARRGWVGERVRQPRAGPHRSRTACLLPRKPTRWCGKPT